LREPRRGGPPGMAGSISPRRGMAASPFPADFRAISPPLYPSNGCHPSEGCQVEPWLNQSSTPRVRCRTARARPGFTRCAATASRSGPPASSHHWPGQLPPSRPSAWLYNAASEPVHAHCPVRTPLLSTCSTCPAISPSRAGETCPCRRRTASRGPAPGIRPAFLPRCSSGTPRPPWSSSSRGCPADSAEAIRSTSPRISRSTTTAYRPSLPPKCSYTTGLLTWPAAGATSSIEAAAKPFSANHLAGHLDQLLAPARWPGHPDPGHRIPGPGRRRARPPSPPAPSSTGTGGRPVAALSRLIAIKPIFQDPGLGRHGVVGPGRASLASRAVVGQAARPFAQPNFSNTQINRAEMFDLAAQHAVPGTGPGPRGAGCARTRPHAQDGQRPEVCGTLSRELNGPPTDHVADRVDRPGGRGAARPSGTRPAP